MNTNKIFHSDALQTLKGLESESIDCIVTDPPYFLITDSGKGFMGKDWDSINMTTGYKILCQSKEFAHFVQNILRLLKVESNTAEANIVQPNVKTEILVEQNPKDLQSNVLSVEKNSNEVNPISKVNINSVQTIVLTKAEVLDLLNELSTNPTILNEFKNLPENVLFAIPYSHLIKRFRGIVPDIVLKLPIEQQCEAKEIQVSSMEEAKIKSVIEAMIGNVSGLKSTNETITPANSVENIVNGKKSKHIIFQNTDKQKTTKWIIWLLYVINVIQRRTTIPTTTTLSYDLIYQFHKTWATESIRVLKSGAFAFIMSAPRQDVLDVMIQALKDSGYVTNFTSIFWTFASGFPKAANVSKLVDKKNGAKREVIGKYQYPTDQPKRRQLHGGGKPNNAYGEYEGFNGDALVTAPKSEQAKKLDGSYAGFQPKPALETILVVMKPLSEKSFVDQALKNGKGCTWLDDCRIPFQNEDDLKSAKFGTQTDIKNNNYGTNRPSNGHVYNKDVEANPKGRFPANLIVSDDSLNDGKITGGKTHFKNGKGWNNSKIYGSTAKGEGFISYEDKGSYSRYFDLDAWYDAQFIITPKASASERNKGLENSPLKIGGGMEATECQRMLTGSGKVRNNLRHNHHPTVKPIKLMSYLITMGSRENDLILDPFCGSGTTCIAAYQLNRRFIGIEKEIEYVEIANKRLEPYMMEKKITDY